MRDFNVTWWPPPIGAKLRHFTIHGGGIGQTAALIHVVGVFEHLDEQRIVTAEWFPSKQRWNYEIFWEHSAWIGMIWQDGTESPDAEIREILARKKAAKHE